MLESLLTVASVVPADIDIDTLALLYSPVDTPRNRWALYPGRLVGIVASSSLPLSYVASFLIRNSTLLPYFGYLTLLAFCVPVSDGFLNTLNRFMRNSV